MDEVGPLLRDWRERAGLSQNALARLMGVNPAYVNRLEHGGRGAHNRDLLESAADALGLSVAERDQFLAAGGHWPSALERLGPADPALRLVADLLADPALDDRARRLFRIHLRLAALPWRPLAANEEVPTGFLVTMP